MSCATPGGPTADKSGARHDGIEKRGQGRWRAVVGRLLVIAGLCAFAVAQPTLDLLGGSPATFQVNRIEGSGIVLFAVVVVLAPPLILWLVGEASIGLHRQAGRMVHLGFVAALFGIVGILFTKELTDNAVVNSLVGLAVAVAGTYAYRRFEAIETWIRLLSAANLLFLGQFVFLAPVSDWIDSGTQRAIEIDVEFAEPPPSVLMLVFDEWPTQSILDDDETVDEVRFPNLAAFADDATWYRHFTTVSPFTQSAVPALLDGLDPHGEPTWNDHPDSLFSLLADSHHLVVSESITQMCGFDGCGVRPVPPPPAEDAEIAPPTLPEINTGPRWGQILDAAWGVWTDRITPGPVDATETFDDFEEEFTPVEQDPDLEPDAGQAGANDGLDEDEIALERFLATQVDAQPRRHQLFVDALRPTDEPFLGYLHMILPHQPWTFRETGTAYDVAADRHDFEDNSDPWPVRVTRQRHLLQAEYADRLLGVILNRLKEIGEYEDTLIVVVSDHGVGFEVDDFSRRVSDTNLEQIAYSPLFIKAPGQDSSKIDDANVNSTDVTPTIAHMLGIELPWATDGRAVASADLGERGGDKYIYSFSDAYDYEFLGIEEFDDDVAYGDLLAGRFPTIAEDDERIAGLYRDVPGSNLIDRSADLVFGPVSGVASVVDIDRLLKPRAGERLLGEVAGRVPDAPTGSTVLVAVNDRIVGVSPLYQRHGEENSFVILLPGDALDHDANTIKLGLRQEDGTVAELDFGGS